MMAPRRPVLKNFCQATETPQRVSSSIDIDIQRSDASNEEHARYDTELTSNHEARKVAASPERSSQVFLAKTESRSDAGILATAKKAICIPSRRPTTLMRMKKTMTAAHSGNTFPHGGLALEQTSQSHSEGKPRNERSKAAEVEEEALAPVRGASLIL
jgi:hypothetical protein